MRRFLPGARRNELEGARPSGSAPMFSMVFLFDGAMGISAPTLPGTKSVQMSPSRPPIPFCFKFHRRPPFLADAKPYSQSSTCRVPLAADASSRARPQDPDHRFNSQRTPLSPPAIFGLKDSINRGVTHEQCFHMHRSSMAPQPTIIAQAGCAIPTAVAPSRGPNLVQEPTLGRPGPPTTYGTTVKSDVRFACDHTASAVGQVFPAVPLTPIHTKGLV